MSNHSTNGIRPQLDPCYGVSSEVKPVDRYRVYRKTATLFMVFDYFFL